MSEFTAVLEAIAHAKREQGPQFRPDLTTDEIAATLHEHMVGKTGMSSPYPRTP